MSFPAEAFTRIAAQDAEIGTLVLLRGDWALRCQFEPENGPVQQLFWLTGERAGQISGVPKEISLAVKPTHGIQIRLKDPRGVNPIHQTPVGVITVNSNGEIAFWGHILGSHQDVYAFSLQGKDVTPIDRDWSPPFLTFDSYEIWLARDGAQQGDSPLFATIAK
ncbi:hypothetical protein [Stenotrophomonas sp.]|uniref:hypothetical protein n=1 Tax=Stenotrophomonas sp. TaxID=69392 RepID=UPI0028B10EB2|nr:hypothetical protein [Stenotrophomonas sp.]